MFLLFINSILPIGQSSNEERICEHRFGAAKIGVCKGFFVRIKTTIPACSNFTLSAGYHIIKLRIAGTVNKYLPVRFLVGSISLLLHEFIN